MTATAKEIALLEPVMAARLEREEAEKAMLMSGSGTFGLAQDRLRKAIRAERLAESRAELRLALRHLVSPEGVAKLIMLGMCLLALYVLGQSPS